MSRGRAQRFNIYPQDYFVLYKPKSALFRLHFSFLNSKYFILSELNFFLDSLYLDFTGLLPETQL